MPVQTPGRDYATMHHAWKRCRDVYAGSDAVKAEGPTYLPMLESHKAAQMSGGSSAYESYKQRALFYPAFRRTIVGLGGLTCGKAPTVAGVPDAFRPCLKDITGTGVSVAGFAYSLSHELLVTGRVGVLVDLPGVSVGAAAEPYWCSYRAEDILQVRTQRVGTEERVTLVVLREEVEVEQDGDPFTTEYATAFRVLSLDDGRYTVTMWREDAKNRGQFVSVETRVPLRRGQPLPFIPFVPMNPVAATSAVDQPPLLALADVNLSHYRTSADREHGAHFTGLPTPWISGHTPGEGETLGIGSGSAWVFPDANSRCGMLEFTGQGLGALEKLMDEKRQMMTTLGARMLESQKATAEAAETVKLRHAGESSELSVLAMAIGQGLSQALRWSLAWAGFDESVVGQATVTLNPDLLETMSPDEVRALVTSWQAGAVSHQTVYHLMQRGQWTRPDVSFEQEQQDIEEEAPEMPKNMETAPRKPMMPMAGEGDEDAEDAEGVGLDEDGESVGKDAGGKAQKNAETD